MLTLEQYRQIDPELRKLSDEELIKIRAALYELGQIIFDDWLRQRQKSGSKYPVGDSQVLRDLEEETKL
jgi:hypothetical protein